MTSNSARCRRDYTDVAVALAQTPRLAILAARLEIASNFGLSQQAPGTAQS
jgi:hypothetical protein